MRHTEVVQVGNKQRGMQMRMNQNEERKILGWLRKHRERMWDAKERKRMR